jgi:hypothetical protein
MAKLTSLMVVHVPSYGHVTCDFRGFGICGCAIQLGDFCCLVFAGPYSELGYPCRDSRIKENIRMPYCTISTISIFHY